MSADVNLATLFAAARAQGAAVLHAFNSSRAGSMVSELASAKEKDLVLEYLKNHRNVQETFGIRLGLSEQLSEITEGYSQTNPQVRIFQVRIHFFHALYRAYDREDFVEITCQEFQELLLAAQSEAAPAAYRSHAANATIRNVASTGRAKSVPAPTQSDIDAVHTYLLGNPRRFNLEPNEEILSITPNVDGSLRIIIGITGQETLSWEGPSMSRAQFQQFLQLAYGNSFSPSAAAQRSSDAASIRVGGSAASFRGPRSERNDVNLLTDQLGRLSLVSTAPAAAESIQGGDGAAATAQNQVTSSSYALQKLRKFGRAGDMLSSALPFFSLDLVGLVAEYFRQNALDLSTTAPSMIGPTLRNYPDLERLRITCERVALAALPTLPQLLHLELELGQAAENVSRDLRFMSELADKLPNLTSLAIPNAFNKETISLFKGLSALSLQQTNRSSILEISLVRSLKELPRLKRLKVKIVDVMPTIAQKSCARDNTFHELAQFPLDVLCFENRVRDFKAFTPHRQLKTIIFKDCKAAPQNYCAALELEHQGQGLKVIHLDSTQDHEGAHARVAWSFMTI